ncbi:MAG: ATPase, partial [Magnetococcales bacterium]|nr:ATPase [Magnetococcales bacterium]
IGLLEESVRDAGERHGVARWIRVVARLQWYFQAIRSVEAGESLARLGGWIPPGIGSGELNAQLRRSGVRALAALSDDGPGDPPLLLVNPWWARPFEIFPRLLGMPARHEVDPSRLLALVAPMLFGYMFGDVGQGVVLLGAGWFLRRRLEVAWLLMTGGMAAIFFGLLFGSLFCVEELIPALWIHPTRHPLEVLAIPLGLGVGLILAGMGFQALGARWQGHGREWLRHHGGVVLIYLGGLLAFFSPLGYDLAMFGGVAWLAGNGMDAPRALPGRLAHLVETVLQLGVNTFSFARVGAFALAHAGLSHAVVTLAGLAGGGVSGGVVLLLGNLLILGLEGLVVSVQTTRLILFEFFVRFLGGEGRPFRPLPPPD